MQRYVTEMGMGVDVHGYDYTKAARRAVSDAIRHSSLNFFRALNKTPNDMHIRVRIGVAKPDAVDTAAVAAELPYGKVTVEVVSGGLDVPADQGEDGIAIASAAVLVYLA
ncbi:MAG: Lin0512 family protein [Pseudomonadales bacterium]